MAGEAPGIADFQRGWEHYQRLLAAAIAPLTAEQLTLQASGDLWSIGVLGLHVVAARAWWFHSWMGEGGPEFEAMVDWDEQPLRPAGEIVEGLESTWRLIDAALRRWTAADFEEEFIRPVPNAAGERPRRSRGWIVWHVMEHDLHHGGEISLSLGMHGLRGLDL